MKPGPMTPAPEQGGSQPARDAKETRERVEKGMKMTPLTGSGEDRGLKPTPMTPSPNPAQPVNRPSHPKK